MAHLKPAEIVDAAEERLPGERRRHLDTCDRCRAAVSALAATLARLAEAPVPEPSPLFWDHFSARVRAAIEAEPGREPWRTWLQRPLVVRAAWVALPVLVVGLLIAPRLVTMWPPETPPPAPLEGGLTLTDDSFAVVADLVGPLDWETAGEIGLVLAPGTAERAALELSAEEQIELRRLLEVELQRLKSS